MVKFRENYLKLKMRKIIDLTFTLEEGMTTYPVPYHPKVKITQLANHKVDKRETRKIILGTHTGTHIDAPKHFIDKSKSIDKINLENCMGRAKIIDFSKMPLRHEISIRDINKYIKKKNSFKIVIFKFNWDKNINNKNYYVDHPYFSDEAAEYIVKSNIKIIGMDTPMPDNPLNGKDTANDSPVHKILLKNNIFILEYLCNLDKIKEKLVNIIIAPLKIKYGDGAPCRVWTY